MSLFRSRGFIIAALTYAAIALVCTQVPLLNYLGYEFSALIGLVGATVSGLLTILFVKPAYHADHTTSDDLSSRVLTGFKQGVALNIVALVIPLVIALTNALFVRNCSVIQGLAYFLLIPLVSSWFGSALGFLCAVHYRFSKIMFLFYCLLLLAYSAAVGYFTPAIFSYNFLYGYFPGVTYDEALSLSWTLVFFRLLSLSIGSILVWLSMLLVNNCSPEDTATRKGGSLLRLLVSTKHRIATGVIVAGLFFVWEFRGEIGFESTGRFIQKELGSRFSTEHFTTYYSRNSYDDEEIKWVAAEHEFRLKQVADAFFVPVRGTIGSYIYPSSEAKQRLIGTGTTNIAKPWSEQVHITKQSLDPTLKHELVHVLAAPFGLPVIRASLSTGLVEGVAVAIEWDWGNRTPHQYAAAMRKFGVMPDIEPLMLLTGFASQASAVSYVVCGSFCRFLIDRYGMRKMMQVYRTGDYNLTYGLSLKQLVSEWHGFLQRVQVADQDRDAIDVLFRRPPIFRKTCARVTAERNTKARKMYEQKEYKAAEALFGESYTEGKSYEALSGYLMSALGSGNTAAVVTTLDSIIMTDPHPAQYLPLFITIGDAFWILGNKQRANELYVRVRRADLSLGLNESASLRALAANDTLHANQLRPYFMSDLNDTARLEMVTNLIVQAPRAWMPRYLKGRLLVRTSRFQESLDLLTPLAISLEDSLLEALRLRMIGYDMFRLRRFQEARATFWNSLNYLSTEVAVNEVNDWVDRCEWMEHYNHK